MIIIADIWAADFVTSTHLSCSDFALHLDNNLNNE